MPACESLCNGRCGKGLFPIMYSTECTRGVRVCLSLWLIICLWCWYQKLLFSCSLSFPGTWFFIMQMISVFVRVSEWVSVKMVTLGAAQIKWWEILSQSDLIDWLIVNFLFSLIRPSVLCTLLTSKRFAQLTKNCLSHVRHVKDGWLLENGENHVGIWLGSRVIHQRTLVSPIRSCVLPSCPTPLYLRRTLIGSDGRQSCPFFF